MHTHFIFFHGEKKKKREKVTNLVEKMPYLELCSKSSYMALKKKKNDLEFLFQDIPVNILLFLRHIHFFKQNIKLLSGSCLTSIQSKHFHEEIRKLSILFG